MEHRSRQAQQSTKFSRKKKNRTTQVGHRTTFSHTVTRSSLSVEKLSRYVKIIVLRPTANISVSRQLISGTFRQHSEIRSILNPKHGYIQQSMVASLPVSQGGIGVRNGVMLASLPFWLPLHPHFGSKKQFCRRHLL